MIIEAELISQPYSGEYSERVYDNESVWNSQSWTYVKFTDEDCFEWCGQFRGSPKKVAISKPNNTILVLTSDYLFQIDLQTGNLTDLENQPLYKNLTVAPNGDFILADNSNFEKITTFIKVKEPIESPIEMDMIEFQKWNNTKLEFICEEFLNWERHLSMIYDSETNKIEIIEDKQI
ncbi:hypothetical protein [Flavobacterium tibetense]|uniref:hypothetical protein n=1 Tax=Flavobacterium tibetense TaxID=2233533 RepID=UPI001874A76B|nr:hypothetical protein [Flavobacterium tibetense]